MDLHPKTGAAPELSCMTMFLRLKHHDDKHLNMYKHVTCTWVESLELIGFTTIRGSEGYWACEGAIS